MSVQAPDVRCSCPLDTRSLDQEKRSVRVVASSMTLDSYGEVIAQDWNLSRFEKNPAVLWGHDAKSLPIGHASDVRVEDDQLKATLHLVDEKANPLAEQVFQGIIQGSIRAVSVGFTPGSASTEKINGKDTIVLRKNSLFEISFVPIGANEDAVIERARSMKAIREMLAVVPSTNVEPTKPPKPAKASVGKGATLVQRFKSMHGYDPTAIELKDFELGEHFHAKFQRDGTRIELRMFEVDREVEALYAGLTTERERELARTIEDGRRKKLVTQGMTAGRISPAMKPWCQTLTLSQLAAFVEYSAPFPQLDPLTQPREPAHEKTALKWRDKTFRELDSKERLELFEEDETLYRLLKDSEGVIGPVIAGLNAAA